MDSIYDVNGCKNNPLLIKSTGHIGFPFITRKSKIFKRTPKWIRDLKIIPYDKGGGENER